MAETQLTTIQLVVGILPIVCWIPIELISLIRLRRIRREIKERATYETLWQKKDEKPFEGPPIGTVVGGVCNPGGEVCESCQ